MSEVFARMPACLSDCRASCVPACCQAIVDVMSLPDSSLPVRGPGAQGQAGGAAGLRALATRAAWNLSEAHPVVAEHLVSARAGLGGGRGGREGASGECRAGVSRLMSYIYILYQYTIIHFL